MDLRRFFACIIAAVFIILSVPALADEGEIHVDDAFLGGGDEDPSYTEPVIEQEGKVLRLDDGSVILTITAVGDITIGRNVQYSGKSIFTRELEKQNNDPNFIFRNIHTVFEADTLTIANFEGVLADEYQIPTKKRNNDFLFLAPTEYASILPRNSVEMVTIENNHTGDFGEAGLESTRRALTNANVKWADKENVCIYEVEGFRIALVAYQTLNQPYTSKELEEIVDGKVKALKQDNDLVFVYFHWGNELDYSPKENQISLGRAAIDSGADLVLGAHSHRINPIECYNGKYIVYSLANCSFAGNNKPSDMFTFVFQTRFRYKNGQMISNIFRIIPCRISSRKDYNDFAITPLTEQTNIDTVINTMLNAGRKLNYAVTSYPLEWE
ncbi:MAG: CapA family protein [Clostridia bacterium]|nr:CapA family protein [Clostridia bacterium]